MKKQKDLHTWPQDILFVFISALFGHKNLCHTKLYELNWSNYTKKNIFSQIISKKIGMDFPTKLGHNYTFDKLFDLSLLHTQFATHRRLRVFHHKGTRCVKEGCTKEGVYLIKAKNTDGGYHTDLYTLDFELMTIDHIIPKSKGGKNTLDNLQPMCNSCNAHKADKV